MNRLVPTAIFRAESVLGATWLLPQSLNIRVIKDAWSLDLLDSYRVAVSI
jgi:hypothetical protein